MRSGTSAESPERRLFCGREEAKKKEKKKKRLNCMQEVLCGMRNQVIPTTLTPRACPTAAAPSEATEVSRFS